jgi:hypothetical protein
MILSLSSSNHRHHRRLRRRCDQSIGVINRHRQSSVAVVIDPSINRSPSPIFRRRRRRRRPSNDRIVVEPPPSPSS